jgi:hypothetical protein
LSAAEFVTRVGGWLKEKHGYSLTPTIPGGGDPLVRWLGSREAGHCELFAGSFVLLARTAGIPARVVTGFRGGSWNGFSNNFTIRNADAHAWAEIFDETTGAWLLADPLAIATAAQAAELRGESAVASRLDRSWKARIDSLRVFWYRRIVSFDQRSQVETLKAMKEATQQSGKMLRETLANALVAVKDWIAAPWDLRRGARLLALLIAAAGIFWAWREFGRAWWRTVRRAPHHGREDPIRREAGRWLCRISASAGREPEARTVRADLERLRFGPRSTWPEAPRVFRRARHVLRETRRRAKSTRS